MNYSDTKPKKFTHKNNLKLEMSGSVGDKKKVEKSSQIDMKCDRIASSQSSVEIGPEAVIFKKDNFAVDSKCIKQLNTGEQLTAKIDPKDLEIGEFIGSGASGSVHLAVYKPKNTVIAIKSISIYDKEKRKQFKNDLRVLSDNQSPYLVRFYGAFFFQGTVKILLEYMNLGSLDRVIQAIKAKNIQPPCVPEVILSKITNQILQGLLYLHKKNHQIHRDIKPANILLNTNGLIKLTDFGIAKTLENTTDLSKTFVGTKNFMSPERIMGKEYSYSSDIWSLGLIIYELATGKFPYEDESDFLSQITRIVEGPEPSLLNDNIYENTFSSELQDFISKCLKKDPAERDSVSKLCGHPWIVQNSDQDMLISDWLADLYDYMLIDESN